MIYAYDKIYLEKARVSLGGMLDFAINDLGESLSGFWEKFLSSTTSELFEMGDIKTLVGMSGIELAYDVLNDEERISEPRFNMNRSVEYWVGWAICYFQWKYAMSFKEISSVVSIEEIAQMYDPYHEMDIQQFCDELLMIYIERKLETNLKRKRRNAGISQKQLADSSGVPLRTLQQYEQGQKNINKARAEYVISLARVLCCDSIELLEVDNDVKK